MPRSTALVALALGLATSAACDRGSTTPVEPSTSAASQQLVAVTVTGPRAVDVGSTRQFRATARFADGATRDVTSEALFTNTTPAVLDSVQGGIVTGLQPGDGLVAASFLGLRSPALDVIVVPAGTFRLAVRVVDADAPYPTAVSRVTIEAIADQGSVPAGVPDSYGRRFHGLRGRVALRIAHPFYVEHHQTIDLTQHEDVEIRLKLANSPVDLTGSYTLTLEASRSCERELGDIGMSRSYPVALTQGRAGGLVGRLTGATFPSLRYGQPNFLSGWVVSSTQTEFDLRDFGLGDTLAEPTIVEALPDGRFYAVRGLVAAAITGSDIVGSLNGDIRVTPTPYGSVGCQATDHRFTLTRR